MENKLLRRVLNQMTSIELQILGDYLLVKCHCNLIYTRTFSSEKYVVLFYKLPIMFFSIAWQPKKMVTTPVEILALL